MRRTKQTGHILKHRGFWVLRYRERVAVDGEIRTVQRAVRLAEIGPDYKTKASVRDLAEDRLRPLQREGAASAELPTTLGDFVERRYLPHVDEQKRLSTRRGYHQIWEAYLKSRVAKAWLREVKTCHVQTWLRQIAKEHSLTKTTLQHIKHFLSGVFRFAAQQGFRNGVANPVKEAEIPAFAPRGKEPEGYSLEEINTLLRLFAGSTAGTALAVFAYTALRHGEVKGLQWSDYTPPEDGELGLLHVRRNIVRGNIGEPKTEKSKAPIPVIPQLAEYLNAHRRMMCNPATGWIFANGKGKPLSFNWLLADHILPVLERCVVCREAKKDHVLVDHEFKRDPALPCWKKWKGFRTALASNLNRLGVPDAVTQRILRHSHVGTTQRHYIKSVSEDAVRAMRKFSDALPKEEKTATAANCAPDVLQKEQKAGKPKAHLLLQ